ncbi:MAG: hypothetical protein BGO43_14805 [Gammaproteobacteria bacterium 39-13]|nr:hypothetical protein [Gammaproteobacteria bacterium]OJV95755.1 MAG: hypothetical protein BGO43_14805 [Gammaproteobacteria bacterium 39-13]
MLRHAAIFLAIGIIALVIVILLNVAAAGTVYILKIISALAIIIGIIFFILDIVKRMMKSKKT